MKQTDLQLFLAWCRKHKVNVQKEKHNRGARVITYFAYCQRKVSIGTLTIEKDLFEKCRWSFDRLYNQDKLFSSEGGIDFKKQ